MFLFMLKENQKDGFTQKSDWNNCLFLLSKYSFLPVSISCLNLSFHFILNLLICSDFRFSLAALSQLAEGIKLRPLIQLLKGFSMCFSSKCIFISIYF